MALETIRCTLVGISRTKSDVDAILFVINLTEFLILNVTGLDVVERDLFCTGTWGRTLFAHIFLSRRVSMGGGCEGEGEKRDLPSSPRNLIPSC